MRRSDVKKWLPLLAVAMLLVQTNFASSQWLSRWRNPFVFPSEMSSPVGATNPTAPSGINLIPGGGPTPVPNEAGSIPVTTGTTSPGQTTPAPAAPAPSAPAADGKLSNVPANDLSAKTVTPPATPAKETTPPTGAHIRIHVPADAKIYAFEHLTAQKGEWRNFVTPPLTDGQTATYDFRVIWIENGKDVQQNRKVKVYPGDRVTVDFLSKDSEP